ncbi:hypothetical protein GYMLUDRAFT_251380 [Collybiopsis luxurians FD-317 M1]|uniref:Uncharacterized protein n=1 Tax=Collybiopsis luxurians FD-317 M1 TaxID=944289 RepID=A0A0D0BCM0_9AGAR|nr:hypothetical protein GYMLUDRAFT_251380 [Collybiopsis luxurians FD-317 M1]
MSDPFSEQNAPLSLFGPVFQKLGIKFKGETAYVPCNPATQPEPVPKDESLRIFIEDLAPVFDVVTTLSKNENDQFMENVRIAWFSIWPLEGDDILIVLEKENMELEVIYNKLEQKQVVRAALRARNHVQPGSWRSMFHECLHSSKYADWAHYIPPPLGPIIIELDLTIPEDWFEFATLAICDLTQTQWCKGYQVWGTGTEDNDEEETTDEESVDFGNHDELQSETEGNEE